MGMLRQILREPVVQFLLIGALAFGVYLYVDRTPPEPPREIIEVSPGRIAQLSQIFARTWQRPPTPAEMQGLVDAFVREEIYYREGRKLGLDQDDTVFRRRLQQKMEFLMEPDEQAMIPGEGELETYLDENANNYVIPYRASFEQIFFDPSRRRGTAENDAATVLASLRAGEDLSEDEFPGDATMLPQRMPLTSRRQIESTFGRQFAEALEGLQPGQWSGPLSSEFGFHLVRLDGFEPLRRPELAAIRDVVLRDWRDLRRREISEERYRSLKGNYEIVIDWPDQTEPEAGK